MTAVVLTVREAAARLGIGTALVYDLVADGRLRASRVGNGRGRIRIPAEAIVEYLESTQIRARPAPPVRRGPVERAGVWDLPL